MSVTNYEKKTDGTLEKRYEVLTKNEVLALTKCYKCNSTTDGRYLVTIPFVDSYYDGLTIYVQLDRAYNSTYNTINVNGLGEQLIWFTYGSRMTSHYTTHAVIKMVYRTVASGTAYEFGGVDHVNGFIIESARDQNTTITYGNLEYYLRPYTAATLYRYKLCALNEDNKLVPLIETSNTAASTSLKPTALAFRPHKIYWYNTTTDVAANKVVTASTLVYIGYANTNMAICNFNESLPTYRAIYLCGTFNRTTGLFTLRGGGTAGSKLYYKFVPNNTSDITLSSYFEAGYDYILVGYSYSTANYMQLTGTNTMYHFDGTNLVPYDVYNAKRVEDSIPTVPTKVSELQNDSGFASGTITGIKMNGSTIGTSGLVDLGTVITSHQSIAGKLDKLTYEWHKSISFGSSGYLKIGSFPMYDSNITINIDSTTSQTYHGTVVIATQNVSTTSIGSAHKVEVYDDPSGTIASALRVVWTSGSRNYNVYFVPQAYSKNLIHIRGLGNYLESATDICVSQTGTAPTSTSGLEAVNILTNTFLGKTATASNSSKLNGQEASYYLDYTNLSNKPTIPSVSNATITIRQSHRPDQTFTLNGSAQTINLDNTMYSAATTSVDGLLSATDKSHLDTMWQVWSADGDTDTLVNKVAEVLSVFENYPEATSLVSALADKLDKTGGEVTGDITLKVENNGATPRLIFQRGALNDNYNDRSMYDSGGYLYVQQRGSASNGWETRATFTQSGVTFAGTVNGYSLNAASAKAVDTSIAASSTSANLPTSAAVATFVEGKGYALNSSLTSHTGSSDIHVTAAQKTTWNSKSTVKVDNTAVGTLNLSYNSTTGTLTITTE